MFKVVKEQELHPVAVDVYVRHYRTVYGVELTPEQVELAELADVMHVGPYAAQGYALAEALDRAHYC